MILPAKFTDDFQESFPEFLEDSSLVLLLGHLYGLASEVTGTESEFDINEFSKFMFAILSSRFICNSSLIDKKILEDGLNALSITQEEYLGRMNGEITTDDDKITTGGTVQIQDGLTNDDRQRLLRGVQVRRITLEDTIKYLSRVIFAIFIIYVSTTVIRNSLETIQTQMMLIPEFGDSLSKMDPLHNFKITFQALIKFMRGDSSKLNVLSKIDLNGLKNLFQQIQKGDIVMPRELMLRMFQRCQNRNAMDLNLCSELNPRSLGRDQSSVFWAMSQFSMAFGGETSSRLSDFQDIYVDAVSTTWNRLYLLPVSYMAYLAATRCFCKNLERAVRGTLIEHPDYHRIELQTMSGTMEITNPRSEGTNTDNFLRTILFFALENGLLMIIYMLQAGGLSEAQILQSVIGIITLMYFSQPILPGYVHTPPDFTSGDPEPDILPGPYNIAYGDSDLYSDSDSEVATEPRERWPILPGEGDNDFGRRFK